MQTETARIVRRVNLLTDSHVSFLVEVRKPGGPTHRWPQAFNSHDDAMLAADHAGVEVLPGWFDEYA